MRNKLKLKEYLLIKKKKLNQLLRKYLLIKKKNNNKLNQTSETISFDQDEKETENEIKILRKYLLMKKKKNKKSNKCITC